MQRGGVSKHRGALYKPK